ncbi:MAG TPA: hypothetical protein VHX65_10715 [Pirellulales bacterium]|nr:hypothetical protein [Pirellulales bacterium]
MDYFVTLGGGPSREANQASLEANVLFFKQLVKDKHTEPFRHDIFFAHGDDPGPEVQVVAEKAKESDLPATDLLASLHRRSSKREELAYRKQHVTEVAGALDPQLIREDLEKLAKTATSHDRLIIYVTAHGNPGPQDDPFNTSIDCWDSKKITAREFSRWLDKLPHDMPVVMVMAQCFCGGFGRLIFQDLDESKGFTTQPRVGFFAQQHDLPAAGCRPDIEHDEEFSSYFWGAVAGHRRSGASVENCDLNGDGVVSFAEAYAYAVAADDTIDIPLRTSDIFLRKYSRLNDSEAKSHNEGEGAHPNKKDNSAENSDSKSTKDESAPLAPKLATMSGSLQSFVDRGDRISGRIVSQLAKTLEFKLDDDVSAVRSAYEDQRRGGSRRSRGGRLGSARRDLLKDIAEKWPELGDEQHWQESTLLKAANQKDLLAQIKELPGWKAYDNRLMKMAAVRKEAQQRELRSAKFRRLISALETINLATNLPLVAKPEVVERYRQIVALEATSLTPTAGRH